MFQKLRSKLFSCFRNMLYLFYFIGLFFPLCALYLAHRTGNYNQFGWWFGPTLIVLIGIEQLLGRERADIPGDQRDKAKNGFYYSFLILLGLPATVLLSVYGAYFLSNTTELNLLGCIGWIFSMGLSISFLAFSTGHELIHRDKPAEKLIGGFLFAYVCNAVYITEHLRGHHFNVATPADSGSADLKQSYYLFLPQALRKAFVNAWRLEKKRLNRKGFWLLSWRNELIKWHLISIGIGAFYYLLFDLLGLIFFICQGLIAIALQNVINYIQHYGLKRRQLDNGRYEKFCGAHAWSCNFLLSNIASFNFSRHTDHHLNPRRPYQLLRHIADSPQMPVGYFGMFLIALIPPLWFRVMNPRVLAFDPDNRQKSTQTNIDNRLSPYPSTGNNIK